ncbi:MAG TPA: LysR substrate-binding domain-containing protein, partial [Bdellovibrionales bacterium]|nr:LysR substrate-binding domain-containing protein [Bdellovibrionales bacterium]
AQFVPVALRGAFQVCVHTQELDWPRTWSSEQVGYLRWHLCARKDHPVFEKPGAREVAKYPFVFPVYWTQEGFRYGSDQCPLPMAKRVRGVETTTAAAAAEIVRQSDHLAFVPELAVRPYLQRGELMIVPVTSWRPVAQPVFLSVKNDVVKQSVFERLQVLCRKELA